MIKHKLNQAGMFNVLIIPIVILSIGLIAAIILASSYYSNYIDARDAYQPKIDSAVAAAEATQEQRLEADFAAREKLPNKSYTSSSQTGTIKLIYPKTWSSYVVYSTEDTVDYFAHPNFVPSTGVNYALRMSAVNRDFATELKAYEPLIKKGDLIASSVSVSGVQGTRLDGFLAKTKEGSMVIFPLRDKTLRVWTESKDFRGDFDNTVLKNLTFVP